MKRNLIQNTGKVLLTLAALIMTTSAFAAPAKETMCVKQKDGTYKCKASGKTMKEPCCDTPSNEPQAPKPKK
ncbi:MAG: hypothetical protein DLM52_00935 [Chthoniobacterales bacterium]|nr:MAG: hypothetical protein DLM52_00935 [Chthoniobacterales bacterium]